MVRSYRAAAARPLSIRSAIWARGPRHNGCGRPTSRPVHGSPRAGQVDHDALLAAARDHHDGLLAGRVLLAVRRVRRDEDVVAEWCRCGPRRRRRRTRTTGCRTRRRSRSRPRHDGRRSWCAARRASVPSRPSTGRPSCRRSPPGAACHGRPTPRVRDSRHRHPKETARGAHPLRYAPRACADAAGRPGAAPPDLS